MLILTRRPAEARDLAMDRYGCLAAHSTADLDVLVILQPV